MIIDIRTVILALNIAVFLLYGFDKLMAKNKKSRIPEFILLMLALFFGGVGAAFGMLVFNHKTSKMLFRIFVPFSVILNYYMANESFHLLKVCLRYILNLIP